MRALDLPEGLAARIAAFTSAGKLPRFEWDSFQPPSWLAMFAGFGLLPPRHDPLADRMTDIDLAATFSRMDDALSRACALARPHREFLKESGAFKA